MFLAKPRLAISQLQWTQAKKTSLLKGTRSGRMLAWKVIRRQEVIACNCLVAGRDSQIFPKMTRFWEAENNESRC